MKYSIDCAVDQKLTERQKNELMKALSEAVSNTLGHQKSGTVVIYSEE